uniref:uncharacterized protein LOC122602754 isoform X2 n=1 Tax=Erigeron canadensis TaxID=72917 RepID=UPI001CB94009|nr:uncharacterized protein LOC122602754 isoform X2 [Erigeron canadensis]
MGSRGSIKRYTTYGTLYPTEAQRRQHKRNFPRSRTPKKVPPTKEELLQEILAKLSDESLLKECGSGKLYKGQLLRDSKFMDIAAWRLGSESVEGYVDFKTEISMLSSLEHKNISSILEYYDQDNEKIIIYKEAFHGILDQHLCNPTLNWSRRLQICLGVARALNHIHYDVIHCDINTSKILLDKDWEPKIFGFELSTKYPQSWRHRIRYSRYLGSKSIITPKYDVYSYGVLLFEVLCGKKPMIEGNRVKEELDEIIDPNLKKQMDEQSLTLFLKIAYKCLNQQLMERPTMDQIVKELEEALELQWKHENHKVHLADAKEGISSNRLKIPLSEIWLATNNFDEKMVVGCGGFGKVYKARLDVLDIQSLSSVEGRSKDKPVKKSKTVAIKRIFQRSDEQGKEGFLREIELLTRCKHSNIVSLLGFSREDREMILIYEYAFKGSLSEYFGSTDKKVNLTWSQRIKICLDIAHGISYLHTNMEGKPRIIHRDIKSENILLDENMKAKVADFGLSIFHPTNQQASTIYTKNIAGTEVYMDPEYLTTSKYKKESDVYSFGVVLFEILSGRLAYDSIYIKEYDLGLAPVVRRRFNEGTLKELIDPCMIEEDDEHIFTLNRGPNQESFDSFSKVAYQCLAETQAKRPTMDTVIKRLQDALKFQGETTVLSRFRLSDIAFATKNFSRKYFSGLDSNGMVYKAVLDHFDNKSLLATEEKNSGESPKRCNSLAIRRILSSREERHKEEGFFEEIEMHTSYKHPNIVSLLGFCDEGNDKILVYEHGSNGSLDDYLRDANKMGKYTWMQRLHTCLETARGLNHLHTVMDHKQGILHLDIRSANILLGINLEAKIAYFWMSKLLQASQEEGTHISLNSEGIKAYHDPEYGKTSELKKSDIYSFGVVLLEILCGRLAYDRAYIVENENGLAPIARRCFNDGTIQQIIDPALKEETDEDVLNLHRVPIQDSLDTFLRIANHCLAEIRAERPSMMMVIKELTTALNFQENFVKTLQVSLKDVEVATGNFSQRNCVGSGRYWKMYKGVFPDADADANAYGCTAIVARRWDSVSSQGSHQFRTELNIIFKHKHENIVGLVGYCIENDERIIVYEHASNGSLDKHLDDASLTWMKRLEICIDVANGLKFLHGGAVTLKKVVHRNIQSHVILLHDDWKAKISNLELSSLDSVPQVMDHVSDNAYGASGYAYGASGYLDPEYDKQGFLTEKSDIYSFGVVLFEILCGRLAWLEYCKDHSQSLGPLAKRKYLEGKIDEMVFDGIKEQIGPESLATFAEIALKCLNDKREERPMAGDIVIQLRKALDIQEEHEKWEAELPKDYKDIIQMSKTPKIYSKMKRKELYDRLSKGILITDDKVWFSLGRSGESNQMVSASQFLYENNDSHKWLSIPESRFHKITEISDISNMKIQIKITTQILSVGVNYGVHLIFRFCGTRKSLAKQIYVNLAYKMGKETLNAYFATWREDEWMEIELYRFLNDKKNNDVEFVLESFSQCYCGSHEIYVEGLEFRVINNEKHEENIQEEVQQGLNLTSDSMQHALAAPFYNICGIFTQTLLKLFSWSSKEKYYMLSAMEAICDSTNTEHFDSKPSTQSRFQKVIVLLSTQEFRIKCKIESERFLLNTEYVCYLVFKLSDNCRELHFPVKVQDQHQPKIEIKQTQIVYFRTPHSWNVTGDDNQGPKEREDGWMEINLWKFKSELDNDCIFINLKLSIYEGTMSGLVVCGLEFRPM